MFIEFYKYSEVGIKSRNPDLWCNIINFNSLNITFKEKFYMLVNDIVDVPICYCGKSVKFIDMINGWRKYCSKSCLWESNESKVMRRKTCMERFGVDNPSKSESVKNSVKLTNNERFGVDYPLMSDVCMYKMKRTCM